MKVGPTRFNSIDGSPASGGGSSSSSGSSGGGRALTIGGSDGGGGGPISLSGTGRSGGGGSPFGAGGDGGASSAKGGVVGCPVMQGMPFIVPACNWMELAEGYVVEADVPGLAKKNLKVETEKGGETRLIHISGEPDGIERAVKRCIQAEKKVGGFWRKFKVPRDANVELPPPQFIHLLSSLPKNLKELP